MLNEPKRFKSPCSSPIRCARHEKDFFLLSASSSVWDCRLIRRPAKDVRRKREPLSLAKTLGVLSFTPLTMLQACAQAVDFKVGHHFGEGQLDYRRRRRMRPSLLGPICPYAKSAIGCGTENSYMAPKCMSCRNWE